MTSPRVRLRADRVEWREVDGQIVALDLRTSQYLAINPTGAMLWPLLIDGTTRILLGERLIEEFGIDRDTAGRDVDAFLSLLEAQDLIEQE